MAKFKVGDKVKIPKTKSYYSYSFDEFEEEIEDYSEKYLIVKSVENNYYKLKRADDENLHFCCFAESDLELYEENIGNTPPQFEIGEWYKATKSTLNFVYYFKCNKIENLLCLGDFICDTTYNIGGGFPFKDYTFEKVDKNIKEIQDYLPNDHVDKIPNLVVGKYYSFDFYENKYWFKFEKVEGTTVFSSGYRYTNPYSKWEERTINLCYLKDLKNLKEVTEQEAKGIGNTSLVGRWIKILRNPYGSGGYAEVGNYLKIIGEKERTFDTICPKTEKTDYWTKDRFKDDPYFELMPIDFNPEQENKEWIPKVGEWVVVTDLDEHTPYCKTNKIVGQILRFESKDNYWLNNVQNVSKHWTITKDFCCSGYPIRKVLSHEIPNSEIEYADLSKCKITYNLEVFPEKTLKNEEIVVKTAKKPKILVNIQVKNVKIPEIKIPIKVVPKKANRIIIKNFNLTI